MIRVAHVNDDPSMGGITRWLGVILRQLDPVFVHTMLILKPKQTWPPRLYADVIVLHFPPSWASLLWRLGLRLRNRQARIIMVEHSYTSGFEGLHVPHRGLFRLLLWVSYRMADHVVGVSAPQVEWLREVTRLPVSRLSTINPFTDLSGLMDLPPPVRHDGPLRLCGYGRFSSQKGFDFLIEAMRLVSPQLATLRLVGLGPEEAALKAQAVGLPHVCVEGPSPGPEGLFANIDAVVLPSRFEAFGIVAAEARAAARPIIVAEIDGLLSHAMPGVPQLRVPVGNVARLAAAIIWLAGQDLTSLGQDARETIRGADAAAIAAWNELLHGPAVMAAKD